MILAMDMKFVLQISKNEDDEIENFKKNRRISGFLKLMFETNSLWQSKTIFTNESIISTNSSDFRSHFDDLWKSYEFINCFHESFTNNEILKLENRYSEPIFELQNLGYEIIKIYEKFIIYETNHNEFNIFEISTGSQLFDSDVYMDTDIYDFTRFFDVVKIDEYHTLIFFKPKNILLIDNEIAKNITTSNSQISKFLFDEEGKTILNVDIFNKNLKQYDQNGDFQNVSRLEISEDININNDLIDIFLWKNRYVIILLGCKNKNEIMIYVVEKKTIHDNIFYDLFLKETIKLDINELSVTEINNSFMIGNYIFLSEGEKTYTLSLSRIFYDSLINTKITMINDFMNFKDDLFDQLIKRDMEITIESKRVFVNTIDGCIYFPKFLIMKDDILFNFFEVKNKHKTSINLYQECGLSELKLFLELLLGLKDTVYIKSEYDLKIFKRVCDTFGYGTLMKILFDIIIVSWKNRNESKIKMDFLLRYYNLMKQEMNTFDIMILKAILKSKLKIEKIKDQKLLNELSSLFFLQ